MDIIYFSELSVFDLVGDDHTTTNLEECSPSEAHMAFSVEGIGLRDHRVVDIFNFPCIPRT